MRPAMFDALKRFFEQRSETLRQEQQKQHPAPEETSLTDDEFWAILRRTRDRARQTGQPPHEILIDILAEYPEEKVAQFVDMYERLME